MKNYLTVLILLIIIGNIFSCRTNNNTGNNTEAILKNDDKKHASNAEIAVYYFHYSIRCETCVAVENETQKVLNDYYPGEMKKGIFSFQSVNLDNKSSKTLAEKFQIGGQTLIFVKNGKITDLTNDAFMYVTVNPTKFENSVKKTIINLIN